MWITFDAAPKGFSQETYNIAWEDLDLETKDYEEDNYTNKSEERDEGGFLPNSPIVPDMVAVVQDSTLLYFSIACLAFFGVSFTLSVWRYKKNKQPKL